MDQYYLPSDRQTTKPSPREMTFPIMSPEMYHRLALAVFINECEVAFEQEYDILYPPNIQKTRNRLVIAFLPEE